VRAEVEHPNTFEQKLPELAQTLINIGVIDTQRKMKGAD
jgi:hypothetical protein